MKILTPTHLFPCFLFSYLRYGFFFLFYLFYGPSGRFFQPIALTILISSFFSSLFYENIFFFQLFFSNHSLSLMLNFILEIFFKFSKYLSDFFLLIHITIFPNYSPFSSLKLFLATMMVLFFIIFLSFRFCYTIFLFLIQRPNQFFFSICFLSTSLFSSSSFLS